MLKKLLCGATLLCAASFSQAATLSQTLTVGPSNTDFSATVAYDLFDDFGGTRVLTGVSTTVVASVMSEASLESADASATTIGIALNAQIVATDANGHALTVTIPTVTSSFAASAYDGVADFGGTSGTILSGLTGTDSLDESYTDIATLLAFTGTGTSTFNVNAVATSVATGAGNLYSVFSTEAKAEITVVYTYEDVPVAASAPAHVALLGLGLLAFAGVRRNRK